VIAGTLALASGIMIAAAAIPVLRAAGDVSRTLAESGRRAAGSRGHERLRAWLVGSQTALALTLLVSGALLAEGFTRTARTAPGFDPSGVLTAQLRLPEETYRTPEARGVFVRSVLERVRAIPGVLDAAMTGNRFVPGFAFLTMVHVEDQPAPDGQPHTVQFRRSSPGYFRTLRIRQLRGRDFDDRDISTSPMVAIVSRSFADRFWPGTDPLGRRIRRQTPAVEWITIVGVVDDVRDVGYGQGAQATIYIPYAQNNNATNAIGLVVRTASGDPMRTAPALRAAVWSLDPAQPLSGIATLDQFLADSLGPQRFRTVLLNLLAGLGLALAAVGIYGVTARTVAERTREAGVRLALGGDPRRVWLTLAAKPMRAFSAGTAAGAIASIVMATILQRLFPEINGGISAYALGAALLLIGCGSAAAIIGARRVTRVDPMIALRGD
jgi:putative ABC transport system permease protein